MFFNFLTLGNCIKLDVLECPPARTHRAIWTPWTYCDSTTVLQYGKWRNCWMPQIAFFRNVTARGDDSADWLILVPFSILVPQMGWKSPLQRDSIGVWPMFQQYVDTVHIKRLPNPGIASLETTEAAQQELLFWAKLQEYMLVTQLLLDKIKTDKQELGFLCKSCWRKTDQFSLRTKTAL